MLKHYGEQALQATVKALLIVICAGAFCCTAVFFAGYSAFLFLQTWLSPSLAAAATTVGLLLILFIAAKIPLRSTKRGSSGGSKMIDSGTDSSSPRHPRSMEEQLALSLIAGYTVEKDPDRSIALLLSTIQNSGKGND